MSWLSDGIDTVTQGAGDFWDSFTGKSQQRDANAAGMASAREMMAFQERMSSTAHQRQVKDLEAAGINPMLSAQLGGASAPSGAMSTPAPLPSATQKYYSTAMDIAGAVKDQRQAQQSIAESQSREDLNRATAIKTGYDAQSSDFSSWLKQGIKRSGEAFNRDAVKMKRFIQKMLERGENGVGRGVRKGNLLLDRLESKAKTLLLNRPLPGRRKPNTFYGE